ncbi:MAG: hypothetical protein JWQ90_2899 [Hydrocarboniphaga sp.]|uniref:protein kinase domain-containing protein n=1 Tax=Hydrocarboniphaga sp. TaxID=2033016 RepID=UPI00262DC82C|nr:winged helix-turn-helix domain-containing protein [Hydrocarboniphaga sp.]MDB5970449.1 hypothetical protein [Hydrocarboniphaga sp.]
MDNTAGRKDAAGEDAARWRFGEVVLDERTMELLVAGQKAELSRKPLELLMYFVRNPGEVVTKEELFEAVWPGRIVSEASLTNAIGRLRTALGDETVQQLIKSVYGYGYRFMGEVIREDARAAAMPPPGPALDFHDGDAVPFRSSWLLRKRLGAGGGGDAWLATESATQDARVFKFARDRTALSALKREITLSRLMRESLGERADFVRVLDWNLDEAPYFIAIDHCNEGSLSDWADANGGITAMPLEQRLDLLAQAATALAAAHSVGVLHKDLKPSNLLLHRATRDGALQLRLSDFGSARLIDRSRLGSLKIAQLGFTQTVLVDGTSGTPLYLAPELLAGQPPTIRSDVYALGVILYQLVVGDLRRPLAPGWELRVADPLLIEDIGAAAAGDPQHRLGDAAELAERLRSLPTRREQRSREHAARQEAERLKATVDRARARRSLWQALAATLVIGLAATSYLLWRSTQAQRQTLSEAARANAVTAFLTDDLLSAANPIFTGRHEISMREVLDHAQQQLDTAFKDQPRARATLERVIGGAYAAIGQTEQAEELMSAAERDLTAQIGAAATETQLARLTIRNMYLNMMLDYANAIRWSRRIVEAEKEAGWPNMAIGKDAEGLLVVAGCLQQYRHDAVSRCSEVSRTFYLDTLASFGPDSLATLHAQVFYGTTLIRNERYAEAIPVLEPAYQGILRLYSDDNLWLFQAFTLRNRALAYGGEAAGVRAALDQGVDFAKRMYGPEHRLLLSSRMVRAHANLEIGNAAAALAELQDCLDIALRTPEATPGYRVSLINELALTLVRMGRLPQAEAAIADGLSHIAPQEQPSGYWTLRLREQLAGIKLQLKDDAAAERLLRQNLAEASTLFNKGEWLLGWDQYLLGDFLWQRGRHDEARALLVSAHPILLDALGAVDWRTRKAQAALAAAGP